MKDIEKTIYYLTFAKSKLDNNNLSHRKAKEEITELIAKLKLEKMEMANENHIPFV